MRKLTAEVREDILRRLAEGESLRSACKCHDVTHVAWIDAVSKDEELAYHYARAREIGFDRMAEEILEIADDGSNDWMVRNGKSDDDSAYALNGEHVQRSKLRVDARKWLLSKMVPKKYGDKIEVDQKTEHSGSVSLDILSPALNSRIAHLISPETPE